MYRLASIEVPEGEPFKNDALNRQPIVEFLAQLIANLNGPFVLALDAPWGTGKTTLLKMLRASLVKNGFSCVEFNAWEADYTADPLVALLASLKQLAGGNERAFSKRLGGIATAVARRTIIAGAKAATLGVLDLEKEYEKIAADVTGETTGDIIQNFERQKSLLQEFRSVLEDAVSVLAEVSKKDAILIFVDEIDRCRPSYAIELLERVKHLFDVEKVIFVLSLDKPQLEAGIRAVYGASFDAHEYLRRFIDLDFKVPLPARTNFTRSLFDRFGFADFFKSRKGDSAYDADALVEYLALLAEAAGLSLRAQERCFARVRVIQDQTPPNILYFPRLVALLVVLRSANEELYQGVVDGKYGFADVRVFLEKTAAGRRLTSERQANILFAELLVATADSPVAKGDMEKLKGDANLMALDGTTAPEAETARQILGLVARWDGLSLNKPRIQYVANKVDLAGLLGR